MTDKLLEQVSALVDDEVPPQEAELLLTRLNRDETLRDGWERYLLIGEAMRGSVARTYRRDFAARVAAAIENEPALPEGRFSRSRLLGHLRPVAGLAVAASVAMLAVFTLQPPEVEAPAEVVPDVRGSAGGTPLLNAQRVDFTGVRSPELQNQLRRYLLNHSEHSDTTRLRGVMPYVQIAAHDTRPVDVPADDVSTARNGAEPEVPRQ